MLTKEVENSMTKCGFYWTESEYGPLRLQLISTTGTAPLPEENTLPSSRPASHQHMTSLPSQLHQQYSRSFHHTRKNAIIRRVFQLTHNDYPDAPTRKIIHLQYLEWPDMNVPDDCRGILELIKEVDNATSETLDFNDKPFFSSTSAFEETTSAIDEKSGVSKQALSGKRPVLLHCSAGVGRTGGFIAIDAVLDAIRGELRGKRESAESTKSEDAMDVDAPIPVNVSSVNSERDSSVSSQESPLGTASIAINARSEFKQDSNYVVHVPIVPTPTSDGTDLEASGRERESHLRDCMTSATTTSMSTRAWAEDVSCHDYGTSNLPEHQYQPKAPEFGLHSPSSSQKDIQLIIPSDSSSSSDHSLLDLSGSNHHPSTIATDGHYPFPQSSSFTSVATVASPEPSPPRNESSSNLIGDPKTETPSVLADHVPVRFASAPHKIPVHGRSKACAESKRDGGKDLSTLQLPSGGYPRNRSPSPMARTTSDESTNSLRKHSVTSSSNLRVPSFTVGFSSDAEPPSRSVSPSADEGSVASQVSSHHSQPTHHKSLPVRVVKPDPGKNVHDLQIAPVPERLKSPVTPQSAPTGQGSVTATELKPPRPLHSMTTVPLLSSFKNPIYEIMQDMREQRMSLCQSLRQYIFVHAAILEGALTIVDEERQKEEGRKRVGETGGFKRESEQQGEAEGSKVRTPKQSINENGDTSGSITRTEESSRSNAESNEVPKTVGTLAPTSALTVCTSSGPVIPSRAIRDEGEGYFSSFVSQPPITFGLTTAEGVDEHTLESVFSPRPIPQARAVSSLQHHALLDLHFDRKRSKSPSNYHRNGIADLDNDEFQRPSVKRKQPSGEAGEIVTRKRAQNESLSRERERERGQRRAEGKLSHGTHAYPRDGTVDILASGITR